MKPLHWLFHLLIISLRKFNLLYYLVCVWLGQIDVELIIIDFLTQNWYMFGFQNQLKGKKFTLNEK